MLYHYDAAPSRVNGNALSEDPGRRGVEIIPGAKSSGAALPQLVGLLHDSKTLRISWSRGADVFETGCVPSSGTGIAHRVRRAAAARVS